MERSLFRTSQRLVLWLGMVPAVLSLAAYVISSQLVESVHAGRATSDLIGAMDDLLATARNAETGQRGYLLTGDPAYIKPYQTAVLRLNDRIAHFEKISREQDVPYRQYAAIRPLMTDKMAELSQTIDLRKSHGLAAALEIVETGRGKRDMDQLRLKAGELIAGQQRKFELSLADGDRKQRILNGILALGLLVSFLLVVFAYRFGASYAQERDETDRRILDLVTQRTIELSERTKELELRSAELQRSNADLLQFAYVASHDLQEPLRTVASYVGLLARRYQGQLDETADKYIKFAIDGATRMQTLIADLLAYSRVGTQTEEPSVVELNLVLKAVLASLMVAVSESNAQITSASLPTVFANEKRMAQVFQNLLANSIKFRKPDTAPRIEIDARYEDGFWTIRIADNGIGFDPKFSDRIFQVFQRLHSIGSYPGNGIGLAVCRRIVEQAGGKLWAESKPGEGSSFFFSLPAAVTLN